MPQSGLERDPYLFRDTDVLANIPGITDEKDLALFEDAIADTAILEIEHFIHYQKINFKLWRKIHKTLFKEVYLWAGELRTVGLSKGESAFAKPAYIETSANRLFKELADENELKDLKKEDFIKRLAHYYNELNALHPFREGNGRSLKLLLTEVALRAGYEIDWSGISRKENEEASIAGFYGDDGPFEKLFEKIVKNT